MSKPSKQEAPKSLTECKPGHVVTVHGVGLVELMAEGDGFWFARPFVTGQGRDDSGQPIMISVGRRLICWNEDRSIAKLDDKRGVVDHFQSEAKPDGELFKGAS